MTRLPGIFETLKDFDSKLGKLQEEKAS